MRRPVLLIFVLFCLALAAPGAASAATASWSFEPSSFDFGTRLPEEGPTSAAAFKLKNTGETSLAPELVSVTNGGGHAFAMAHNGCTKVLAPGAECTIEVTFDPTAGGRWLGTLAVETASTGVPAATAQLLGSGGEPIVVIEPPTLVFDPVLIPVGAMPTASLGTVTVKNVGSADLSIRNVGVDEAVPSRPRRNFFGPSDAVGLPSCFGAAVALGGACGLTVEFSPLNPGTYDGKLELVDDAADSPQLVPFSGTAVALPPPPPRPITPEATLPKLSRKPPLRTKSRTATFVFSAAVSPRGFTCRTGKRQPFVPCASPVHMSGLKPGRHLFAVRGIGQFATPGPVMSYHWRILR